MLTPIALSLIKTIQLKITLFPNGRNSFFTALVAFSLSFFTLLTSCPVFSQASYTIDKTTRFDNLGINEGLSTDYTKNIHQDKYGFIWIGTQRGLNLYDGYQVESFMANSNDPNAIIFDFISAIFEEKDGTMWFGTSNGLSKYNRDTHTFSNYLPDSNVADNSSNYINQIVSLGENLWVATYGGLFRFNKQTERFTCFIEDTLNPEKGIVGEVSPGYIFQDGGGTTWINSWHSDKGIYVLNRFEKRTNTFKHFEHDPADQESFTGDRITSMIEDKQGTIWISTMGGGLLEMVEKENGKFRQYRHDDSDENSILSDNLNCIFEDSQENLWTCGVNGFSRFNKETGKFINYSIPNEKGNPGRVNNIRDIIEDPHGELWMNASEGLFRFDPLQKKLIHYLNDPENDNSLSNNNVTQIIIDHSGQLWVSTWMKGVCIVNPFSNTFKRIQKTPDQKSSLRDNFVTQIFVDSRENLWIGTWNGGLNKTKINHGKVSENFEHFIFDANDPYSISSNRITDIIEDKNQYLWFSSYSGLNKYNPKTNKFTSYQHDTNVSSSISQNGILSIYEDSRGTFWVSTWRSLNIMDKKTGKFIRILPDTNDNNSSMNIGIMRIFEDSQGELWFGGKYLERLNRNDTSFIHYLTYLNNGNRNISWVYDIKEDDSSNLWIASLRGGVLHWKRKSQVFDEVTVKEGLADNFVTSIVIDDNGDIWAGTNQGLSRIKRKTHEVKNYNAADGLISWEVNPRSNFKDKEGWLYFGTKYGITYFHPDSLKENKLIPPVYITAMNISGKQKFFEKPVYEMSRVELNHIENDLSFDFVALNYVNSQKNHYAYMLEGYDEDWNFIGNRRTAYYTNLSPGTYNFRVKGSNNDGYWNEEGANLMVIIHPPFWKTWWAYVIYVFTFLGLLWLVRRNEIKRINLRQELELEYAHARQLAELDIEKNKFFSNISHEFQTPLTLILGPLDRYIAKLNNEVDKQELSLVRRNARRLQSLINQLLSLSKLESGKMKLKARPENIVKLTRLFVDSFQSMAQDRSIKLEFESDTEEQIVCIDTLKYEKVVNNLLSNAFKFTESGGKIKVSVLANYTPFDPSMKEEKPPSGILVKFSDTGIGIRKEKLAHVFDRFYQVDDQQMKNSLGTGIGLALTKELVELHHGTITVSSEAGMGTTFTIYLPKGEDHLTEDELLKSTTNVDKSEDELLGSDYSFLQDVVTNSEMEAKAFDSNQQLILLVEDNDDMRSYIKSYLADLYNIIEATNGNEGAKMAIEKLPDLIISDLMMPFMDGNEMTDLLKNDERTSHIPIILLTAKASIETKLEVLETGADDFLTKPFDAKELIVRIRNLIEQRKKLREILALHIGDVPQTRIIKESAGKAMNKMDEQFLEKAVTVVNEHVSEPEFSTELFAIEMAMSRVQLHRKLKSLTNNSTGDFIRNLRLKKAAELLKESGLNVTQVSYEVGISSLSYFSKVFKEKYGVNPSDYS